MAALAAFAWLLPPAAGAQSFAAVGTRAAGMGGAFVGVADDATAIYWNPAGLAAGTYFSLVLDGGAGTTVPDAFRAGSDQSSYFLGLSMPALGLGYYRLKASTVVPPPLLLPADGSLSSRNFSAVAEVRLDTLVTHHAGVTLVQSVVPGVAVGATVKLVRGLAASTWVPADTAADVLEGDTAELSGRASNTLDFDVGIMAGGGPMKAGLTVRNVREPGFEVADGGPKLVLERQARAGVSYAVTSGWVAAVDVDLLRTTGAFGRRRDLAVGVEGRVAPRALVRSGMSVNTVEASDRAGTARAAYSVGGSYAARASVYIDGHFTTGDARAGNQWGIAARFVY